MSFRSFSRLWGPHGTSLLAVGLRIGVAAVVLLSVLFDVAVDLLVGHVLTGREVEVPGADVIAQQFGVKRVIG